MYPNVSVCWGLWEWFYVRLSLKRHIYRDLSGVGRDYMIAKLTIYKSVDISKDINKKTNSITYSYKWTPQCYQLVTFYSKKKRDVCNLSNTLQYVSCVSVRTDVFPKVAIRPRRYVFELTNHTWRDAVAASHEKKTLTVKKLHIPINNCNLYLVFYKMLTRSYVVALLLLCRTSANLHSPPGKFSILNNFMIYCKM